MKQIRIFCLLVTSVFVGGSGVAFGHDAACGTLGDEDLILTLPCVVSGDKAYSATLLPIKRPDGNVGKWTLQAGSVKSASFNPGNNNCANFNAGVDLAVRCVLHDGALWSAEFGANYPVFDLRSYEPYTTNELFGDSLGTYKIGDTGPGGGFVYQVDETGLAGKEVVFLNYNKWCDVVSDIKTSMLPKTGFANTNAITKGCPSDTTAASIAKNYPWKKGQIDGYLPSIDELVFIAGLPELAEKLPSEGFFWSSSQSSTTNAWYWEVGNSAMQQANKSATNIKSTAVRAFNTTIKTYKIGDPGPGGGIVFYLDCTDTPCQHGLEAALADAGTAEWGCDERPVGGTKTGIGTGQSNTDIINAKCGDSIPYNSAYLAANFKWPNGQTGGFLPSKDELNELYKHKDVVGGFDGCFCWSSSEYSSIEAWYQYIGSGGQEYGGKGNAYDVRAVRAF